MSSTSRRPPACRYKELQSGTDISRLKTPAAQPLAKAPSLVADAYQALKNAIRDNAFAPGYQGSEQEIALRLGMSRTRSMRP